MALIVAVVCAMSGAAAAQVDDLTAEQIEELKLWLSKANRLYDEGDYAGALKRYREGLDIAQLPEIHYRMATCFEKLDRYAEAVKAYERFLVLDPTAPERGRVEADIARLREKLDGQAIGELEVNSEPPGAFVVVMDGDENPELGKTPVTTPLTAGTVEIRVELDGYQPHEQTVEIPASGKAVVTVVLAEIVVAADPIPPGDPGPPDDGGFDYDLWGWVTAGTGLAVGATSVVLLFVTNSTIQDYNDYDRGAAGASRDEFDELGDSVARFKNATAVTGIVGGLLLASGATMIVIDAFGDGDDGVHVGLAPGGGPSVTVELRW